MNKRMCSPRLSLQLLCQNSEVKSKVLHGLCCTWSFEGCQYTWCRKPEQSSTRMRSISARRYASNSTCRGYNPTYLFVRPFVEVITLLLGFLPGKLKDISYEHIYWPQISRRIRTALSKLHPIKLVVGWLVTGSPNLNKWLILIPYCRNQPRRFNQ